MNISKTPLSPILIVDDEEDTLASYKKILRLNGFNNLTLISDSRKVLPAILKESVSLIILDLLMPYTSGEELLIKIKEDFPHIPVIIVTGSTKVDTAVECMKNGAVDYLVKPIEKSRFLSSIRNVLEKHELKEENERLKKQLLSDNLENPEAFSGIVTINSKMRSIFRYIEAIAESSRHVLITGESGVGKELVAKVIHSLSKRKGKFVPVNIGSLDDNSFLDTLFGHTKGAYTGAFSVRSGLIEQAEEGTLFLDEIGDIEINSQVKLLRLLQENKYYKLGSDIERTSFARIITATSVDLKNNLHEGQFRKELYFRLNYHAINIPPLRERKEDIPLLVSHFVEKTCREFKIENKQSIQDKLYDLLAGYNFPGNIRELEEMIIDAIVAHKSSELKLTYFHDYLNKQGYSIEKNQVEPYHYSNADIIQILTNKNKLPSFREVEEYLVKEALKITDGNQSAAAPLLGITQSSLSRRLKKMDL